ncbi:MAG: tRNA (adenosine(37)-N6)-threonylcarbamoyltransferase complex dimerization subunit type 1 TsaB [Alistipes sp.]|nr:tRNA (adenosine(37)-N6)-threonylcarbamoyltransferase complex dimerization subunit type 1 TsaB [Candidatus Alistipes equi]
MGLILNIETGTDVCSVALANNGTLLSLRESSSGRDHAKRVAVYTDEILHENGTHAQDLSAISVSKGPGSYTGLRIGVSFAKGLSYGLGIPLLGVGSLDSMMEIIREEYAAGLLEIDNPTSAVFCPMIDARRMEVYTQLLGWDGNPLSNVHAEILTENSFIQYRGEGKEFIIFGSGAKKASETLAYSKYMEIIPSARGMVRLSEELYNKKQFEDTAYFEPLYLKDFIVTTQKKKLF